MPTNEELDNIVDDSILSDGTTSTSPTITFDFEEYYQQLESLFELYFYTLEEQEKIKEEEQQKKEEEQKELDLSSEEQNLNTQEFQTQLLSEIKVLQEYQQYNNNLVFFGILIALVIFVSTLIYKIFKTFI